MEFHLAALLSGVGIPILTLARWAHMKVVKDHTWRHKAKLYH